MGNWCENCPKKKNSCDECKKGVKPTTPKKPKK